MNKIVLLIAITFGLSISQTNAQIAINAELPNPSAALDINAVNNNGGLLMPRMTTVQKLAIPSPAPYLMVYDIDYNCISQYKDTPSNPGVFGWTCLTLFNRHFFYMPSINIPTSDGSGTLLTGTQTIDLYNAYKTGFNTPMIKNPSASTVIPHFDRDQLYFYITYHDPCITVTGISNAGSLTYTVNTLPDYDAFVNIVFLVR